MQQKVKIKVFFFSSSRKPFICKKEIEYKLKCALPVDYQFLGKQFLKSTAQEMGSYPA